MVLRVGSFLSGSFFSQYRTKPYQNFCNIQFCGFWRHVSGIDDYIFHLTLSNEKDLAAVRPNSTTDLIYKKKKKE